MGGSPRNPIIYEALKYAYNVNITEFMNHYDLLCKNLFNIVNNNTYNFKIKLYKEHNHVLNESAKTLNDDNKIIFVHYYKYKIIPVDHNINKNTTIIIGSSQESVKIVKLTRSFINPVFKLNNHPFTDDFSYEIHNNILIVKRIDSPYGWGHNHIVEIIEST